HETVGTAYRRYFQQTWIHFGSCLRPIIRYKQSRTCVPKHRKDIEIEGIVERGIQFLDMCTEILKYFHRPSHGHSHLRINLHTTELWDISNSQPLHSSRQCLAIVHAIVR